MTYVQVALRQTERIPANYISYFPNGRTFSGGSAGATDGRENGMVEDQSIEWRKI